MSTLNSNEKQSPESPITLEEIAKEYESRTYYSHTFGNDPSYHFKNGWEQCKSDFEKLTAYTDKTPSVATDHASFPGETTTDQWVKNLFKPIIAHLTKQDIKPVDITESGFEFKDHAGNKVTITIKVKP